MVVLDPAKMTRDREQVIPALKKYLDMNKLASAAVKPGGDFPDVLMHGSGQRGTIPRHAAARSVLCESHDPGAQGAGAGADHPFLAHVPEIALPQGRVLPGVLKRLHWRLLGG